MGLHPPTRGLSLCAGGGGLDFGLMLAEPGFHTECWVEWEAYAQEALIAGQHAGYFKPAPVWDNVFTFDGTHWRGRIDIILAGYPCQPFSAAGRRKGESDERHLWPDIARIIQEVRPRWIFLENVAGHLSLGLDTVLRDLRRMGFNVAAGLFTAAETGASHERARVFIVAHCEGGGWGERGDASRPRRGGHADREGEPVAYADGGNARAEREQRGGEQRFQPEGGSTGRGSLADASDGQLPQPGWGSERRDGAGSTGPVHEVEYSESKRRREGRTEHVVRGGRDAVAVSGCAVDDARRNGRREGQPHENGGGERFTGLAFDAGSRLPLAPPGPSDADAWASVLSMAPDLAPALSVGDVKRVCDHAAALVAQGCMAEAEAQSIVRGMAHGLAERTRALRLYGNGVHPLEAAFAWRSLSYALGLRPVDLGGAGGGEGASAGEFAA